MEITNEHIDGGKAFDWGRTSADYAKFRDIYPAEFYEKVAALGIGTAGQRALDIGTGTGVLPRNMYRCGAKWLGTDISENQIAQARRLSAQAGMDIEYAVSSAEGLDFPAESFDVITACQCFWYFDHAVTAPLLARLLKSGGKLAFLEMEWLPYDDEIAGRSEELVLKYSPEWSGAGERVHNVELPAEYEGYFRTAYNEYFLLDAPFTREGWNGRMKSCRGIGASLPPEQIAAWEREHMEMLKKYAPESFTVKHFAAIAIMEKL